MKVRYIMVRLVVSKFSLFSLFGQVHDRGIRKRGHEGLGPQWLHDSPQLTIL